MTNNKRPQQTSPKSLGKSFPNHLTYLLLPFLSRGGSYPVLHKNKSKLHEKPRKAEKCPCRFVASQQLQKNR
jgi:hypothetical protein